MFAKTEQGVYPDARRYYYILFASAYSTTYEGLLNYDNNKSDSEDNDALAESWTLEADGSSRTYTKQDAIDATTGTGDSSTLNALVQAISEQGSPSPRTLDMLDEIFVQFVFDANSASPRIYEPCTTNLPLPEDIAIICATLLENDLSDYALTFTTSQLEMCHSPDDEVVPIENVKQLGKLNAYLYETTGNHDTAGLNCIRRFVEFFNEDQFEEVRDAASSTQPTGVFCSVPEVPTTPSPSSSPTGSPTMRPTTKVSLSEPHAISTDSRYRDFHLMHSFVTFLVI